MGSATSEYENRILDAIFGDGHASNMPPIVFVGLFVTEPNDAGGGAEVFGGSYSRVGIANDTIAWPNASGGEKRNGITIQFPQATGEWGDVGWFGLFDGISPGQLMIWGNLQTTISPSAGNQPFFSPGGLVVRLD